jgi:hypothetical protein
MRGSTAIRLAWSICASEGSGGLFLICGSRLDFDNTKPLDLTLHFVDFLLPLRKLMSKYRDVIVWFRICSIQDGG